MADWISQWQNLRTRGEIKRAAKEIERNPMLRPILLEALREKNLSFLDAWSAKKLLRVLLDRSQESQQRSNPIHRNEAFHCLHVQGSSVCFCSGGTCMFGIVFHILSLHFFVLCSGHRR